MLKYKLLIYKYNIEKGEKMSNIYFFRGKAATGKTTITNRLSTVLNVSILRKDDIFDSISKFIEDPEKKHSISYEVLANLIQTNVDNKTDIIIDVGLSDTRQLKGFISKINFRESNILYFLCDCSDLEVWKNRFIERLKNPTPNQYFTNVDEIVDRYRGSVIELLTNEFYIDSSNELEETMKAIYKYLNFITLQ